MKMKPLSLSVALMGCVLAGHAAAAGYHFGTQSVSAQATANASAAEAADATTVFYNAAGMTRLKGTHLSGALNLVAPSVEYNNAKATTALGRPIAGSNSGKITSDLIAVPHFYLTHQLNDTMTAGLGVYVPFASATEYQRDSVLRYNVNQTELTTIDINPTIAFKLNDQHSVAVGVIAEYADASLRQYADFGTTADKINAARGVATQFGGSGLLDGFAEVSGNDWGWGFNLGWLWEIDQNTRVGLSYRSPIKHTLSGDAKWTVPSGSATQNQVGALVASYGYRTSDVSVDIETPESLSLHGFRQINPKWAVMGDLTWTKHSRFDVANIVYALPKNAPMGTANATTLVPNWSDSWKLSIGGTYQVNDPLQLRFGVAYDKSPVPSADYRLSTMPDNDRIWLSVGGKYDLNKQSSVNFAYSYIFIKDASANVNGYCGGGSPASGSAKACVSSYTKGSADFDSHAHILGVQYNYAF